MSLCSALDTFWAMHGDATGDSASFPQPARGKTARKEPFEACTARFDEVEPCIMSSRGHLVEKRQILHCPAVARPWELLVGTAPMEFLGCIGSRFRNVRAQSLAEFP